MIDTQMNGTDKLRLTVHHGPSPVCVESRWVDYVLALNTLLGNINAATRIKNYKQ